jgi:selenide, water dikinase
MIRGVPLDHRLLALGQRSRPGQLDGRHRRDEVVAVAELPERRGPELRRDSHRVVGREAAEVVEPIDLELPEAQEPVAPAGRGGDEDRGSEARRPAREDEPVHRPEIVADEGQRRATGKVPRQSIEGRPETTLLQLDVRDVGVPVLRIGHPRQVAGRKQASNPESGVLPCFREELRSIAVMLAEPVQEQDSGVNLALGRFDDERLDRRVICLEPLVKGSDGDPTAADRSRVPADHAGNDAAPTYPASVIHDEVRPIRLTELTECGGCASKLGADALAEALAGLGVVGTDMPVGGGSTGFEPGVASAVASADGAAGLIAGLDPPDDAAVHLVAPGVAVIGTVDFFPPIVDDPRTYGEIAAANALSDVFAMGGRVLFALSVAAIPESLPTTVFREILDGAASKVREAGGLLAGGHTIRDPEPKYGLAVIGVASPDRLLRKGGGVPGDVLILTKRLGTGLLVSGRRRSLTSDADLAAAIDSMRALNRRAAEVLVDVDVKAATDVTGFGLLGHGLEMARASGTRFVFEAAALPALDGALGLARAGVETGGAAHNRRFVRMALTVGADVADDRVTLAHDPQTSGGLLASVPPGDVAAIRAALESAGVESWIVGRVEPSSEGSVALS